MKVRQLTLNPLAAGLLLALAAQGAWADGDAAPAVAVGILEAADLPVDAAGLVVAEQASDTVLNGTAKADRPEAAAEAAEKMALVPAAALVLDVDAGQVDESSGGDAADGGPAAGDSGDKAQPNPKDPFEGFNRKVYAFNDVVDGAVLRPVAEGYRRAVPELARTGVDNFFGNLGDIWSALNKLLQGKVVQSAQMTLRVATNTVFGLGGLLDPATEFGLERQPEDFGQTLGTWGVPAGPYLVLPLLGPSTLRDTAALPLDRVVASPSRYLGGGASAKAGITGVQLVAVRAGLLSASKLLGDVALDKYSFLRDAYLARRRSLVFDGNPPDEDEPESAR